IVLGLKDSFVGSDENSEIPENKNLRVFCSSFQAKIEATLAGITFRGYRLLVVGRSIQIIGHSKKYFKRTQRKYVSKKNLGVSAPGSFEIHREESGQTFHTQLTK
ncbi:MAG: hypothetical protein CL921_07285, partial [Deltaproteobacteria bacterium]|nr:hypothetical protein [Deltaproteobacteria bacterium]